MEWGEATSRSAGISFHGEIGAEDFIAADIAQSEKGLTVGWVSSAQPTAVIWCVTASRLTHPTVGTVWGNNKQKPCLII